MGLRAFNICSWPRAACATYRVPQPASAPQPARVAATTRLALKVGNMRGMQVYLVGGAVRDRLLGRKVTERDWVVVGATPAELERAGFLPVGRDFPVFLHPQTREEHALARVERKVGPGYRGFTTEFSPGVTL